MVVFIGEWSVKPIPYEKFIFGNDRTFDDQYRTFGLFISRELGFFFKRLVKVSNV
jgi:hypothetical protein